MAEPHHRRCLAFEQREDRARRAQAGVVHVDVRIGLIAGEHGRVLGHRGKQVGMHVERDADRQLRRQRADAPEQLALAVVVRLGHHRAVQVEQQRIAALGDRLQDARRHPFVGIALHRAARRGVAGDRQHHLRARFFGELDECADRGAGALEGGSDRLAFERRRLPAREAPQVRRHRREGVGLVLHLRNDEFHGLAQLQFERTILPIMRPVSTRACAARRFSALIGERRSVAVLRSWPASIQAATRSRMRCCSIMSGVA